MSNEKKSKKPSIQQVHDTPLDKLMAVFDPRERPEDTEVDFMAPVLAAERRRPARLAPILLVTIASFFVIALLWANWAEIDQVTRGDGTVIPSSEVKVIDHLEGGIVREILVHEGQIVEAGQLLLKIDNTVAKGRLKQAKSLFYSAWASVIRLIAQIENQPFELPNAIIKEAAPLAKKEQERYIAATNRLENETAIAAREVDQRRQQFLEQKGRLEILLERRKLALEELRMIEPLAKKGIASKVDFIRVRRDVNDIKGEIESAKVNIIRTDAALKQGERRLQNVKVALKNEDLRELQEAKRRLAQAQDAITTEQDRLTRTDLLSPVHGIIKELKVNTISGVVQPGQDLIVIVPLKDTLLIEAQVRPADVAFLHPGLHSVVKITAYDFALYGGLDAKLIEISPDAIFDEEKRQNFFRIKLKTKKNYLGTKKNPLPITPGMTASVDIMTGKKTVLQYILNPIRRASQVALRER